MFALSKGKPHNRWKFWRFGFSGSDVIRRNKCDCKKEMIRQKRLCFFCFNSYVTSASIKKYTKLIWNTELKNSTNGFKFKHIYLSVLFFFEGGNTIMKNCFQFEIERRPLWQMYYCDLFRNYFFSAYAKKIKEQRKIEWYFMWHKDERKWANRIHLFIWASM